MSPSPVENRWCWQFIILWSVLLCSVADGQRYKYGIQGNTYFIWPVKVQGTVKGATNMDDLGATHQSFRENTPPRTSSNGLSDETLTSALTGTAIDSYLPLVLQREYESSTLTNPTAVFISQPQQNLRSSEDIEYVEPQTETVNPSQKSFTNSQQTSFQTTFITPSQNGLSSPWQNSFTNPLHSSFSPGFTTVVQSGFTNPNQGSFTNSSQSGFLPSGAIQQVTSEPPTSVFSSQSLTLSNNPMPGFSTIPQYTNQRQSDCVKSDSTVNRRPVCREQEIFLDTFSYYNSTVWSYDMEFPSLPDSEFCVFTGLADNSRTGAGTLKIIPTLTDEKYGENFVFSGQLDLPDCTATEADHCSQQGEFAYILPPTMSARYSTRRKWHFKYGRVDIVAKLPRGDWLYPEVWLETVESNSQTKYPNRLEMATVRGNVRFRDNRGDDIGASLLEVGASISSTTNADFLKENFKLREPEDRLWSDDYHTYSLLWTKDAIAFFVDGIEIGVLRSSSRVSSLTFQTEMYLVVGLGVGGVRAFPDTPGKPWTNTEPKAMYKFWNAKDQWYRTWTREDSTLTIREIRITSL